LAYSKTPLETVLSTISEVQLDVVQLHGSEPIDWAHLIPIPVIRVFHVGKDGQGLSEISRGGAHQFILLDSLREDGSGKSGGTGKVLDWELAKKVVDAGEIVSGSFGKTKEVTSPAPVASNDNEDAPGHTEPGVTAPASNGIKTNSPAKPLSFPLPIILAGGLTPNNVDAAIAQVRPWAVDVSGGVENEDGTNKDLEKVTAFINAVKGIKQASKNQGEDEEGPEVTNAGTENFSLAESG